MMSVAKLPPPAPASSGWSVERLVRWSWIMLALLLPSLAVAYLLGTALMGALGVAEGELLTAAGGPGWLAAVVVLVIEVLPLVAGVLLALRARRRGGGAKASGPLLVDGLVLGYLLVVQGGTLLLG